MARAITSMKKRPPISGSGRSSSPRGILARVVTQQRFVGLGEGHPDVERAETERSQPGHEGAGRGERHVVTSCPRRQRQRNQRIDVPERRAGAEQHTTGRGRPTATEVSAVIEGSSASTPKGGGDDAWSPNTNAVTESWTTPGDHVKNFDARESGRDEEHDEVTATLELSSRSLRSARYVVRHRPVRPSRRPRRGRRSDVGGGVAAGPARCRGGPRRRPGHRR